MAGSGTLVLLAVLFGFIYPKVASMILAIQRSAAFLKTCHGSLTESTEYDIFNFYWRTSDGAWTRYAQEDMEDLLWANEAERDPT